MGRVEIHFVDVIVVKLKLKESFISCYMRINSFSWSFKPLGRWLLGNTET